MLKVLAYTGGETTPSRVPRVQQYVPALNAAGIEVTECASRAGSFPPEQKWKRPLWAVWNIAEHIPAALRSYRYDLTILHREMLATVKTLEGFTKRPRVFDVDDAIWLYRGGSFARRLALSCDHVICGNSFIAAQFSQWNTSVSVLPTAVDTDRFVPRSPGGATAHPVIGWLGLSSGFRFLYNVEPALAKFLRSHPEVRLRIVSNKRPRLTLVPQEQLEFVPYGRTSEVAEFQHPTIGIMPLDDSDVSRGKCSFKMLQYMACGIPVVVSPFGMNREVLQKGNAGLGAQSLQEWYDSLEDLLLNPEHARRMGMHGRSIVEQHYSLRVLAPRLADTLFAVAGGHGLQPVSQQLA